jgi:HK97 gp10 family phage protein
MTTYRVNGIEQIRATLLALPAALVKKSLQKAVMKPAMIVRDQARVNAPKDSGLMASDIIAMQDKKPQIAGMAARAVVFVKWKGKTGAPYWRFVEFGTAKQPPQPFLRPAFDVNAANAVAMMIDSVASDLPAIVRAAGGQ